VFFGHRVVITSLPVCSPVTSPFQVERQGLVPTELSYIHLAVTPAEARRSVLRLTATPVVLRVDAGVARAEGRVFYSPTEGVYLVESLPAEYVTRL